MADESQIRLSRVEKVMAAILQMTPIYLNLQIIALVYLKVYNKLITKSSLDKPIYRNLLSVIHETEMPDFEVVIMLLSLHFYEKLLPINLYNQRQNWTIRKFKMYMRTAKQNLVLTIIFNWQFQTQSSILSLKIVSCCDRNN